MDRKLFSPFWRLRKFRKSQFLFFDVCSIPANANHISVAFAASLQMPTVFPWRLQRSCKCQPYFRGACSISANANRISVAFAASLQMPTVFPWRLQDSCKCRFSHFDVCRSSACHIPLSFDRKSFMQCLWSAGRQGLFLFSRCEYSDVVIRRLGTHHDSTIVRTRTAP